jgi:hypothetical protein
MSNWTPLEPRDDAAALFGRDYADWIRDAQAQAERERAADLLRRAWERELERERFPERFHNPADDEG